MKKTKKSKKLTCSGSWWWWRRCGCGCELWSWGWPVDSSSSSSLPLCVIPFFSSFPPLFWFFFCFLRCSSLLRWCCYRWRCYLWRSDVGSRRWWKKPIIAAIFPFYAEASVSYFSSRLLQRSPQGEEDGERLTMMLFQMAERETRKRVRLLFFSIISSLFPYLFFRPLFPSLWFQKQSPCPHFFLFFPLLCSFFLFCLSLKTFVHLPKISSLPLLFHPLLFVFLWNLAPPPHPLYFWFSPCIYRKQGEGPPYPVQA